MSEGVGGIGGGSFPWLRSESAEEVLGTDETALADLGSGTGLVSQGGVSLDPSLDPGLIGAVSSYAPYTEPPAGLGSPLTRTADEQMAEALQSPDAKEYAKAMSEWPPLKPPKVPGHEALMAMIDPEYKKPRENLIETLGIAFNDKPNEQAQPSQQATAVLGPQLDTVTEK